jgi:HNH endonuclease
MVFRRTVSKVRAGDITVHYRSGRWMTVVALSRAKTDAVEGIVDLKQYGVKGTVCWEEPGPGWRFEADYYDLTKPIPKTAFIEELDRLSVHDGPIAPPGQIRQGYFMPFSVEGLGVLRRASTEDWPDWASALLASSNMTKDYYFFNTDGKSIGGPPRFQTLIDRGIAVTSGDRSYGEQLGQLAPADTLLMYQNRVGVVAVGTVEGPWDRKSYRDHLYYQSGDDVDEQGLEYRIKVKWFLDLSDYPIGVHELRKILGTIPPRTLQKIVKGREEVARIIANRLQEQSQQPQVQLAQVSMTDDDIVAFLGGLLGQGLSEDRAAPDNLRRGRFQAGWEDFTKRAKRYDALEYLTWTNLGNRCGVRFGDRSREQIGKVYDIAAAIDNKAWQQTPDSEIGESIHDPPDRVGLFTTRIIRDSAAARRLKALYDYRCQICGERIELGFSSFYAEAHHIRPLGGPHGGTDTQDNMLVVCPTHHAMLDLGAAIFSSGEAVIIGGTLYPLTLRHLIAPESFDYHNSEIVSLQTSSRLAGDRSGPLESSKR